MVLRDTPPAPRDPRPDGGHCQTRQRPLYRYRDPGGAKEDGSARLYWRSLVVVGFGLGTIVLGGKGSETHTVCVVGDPFKDTSGHR